MINKFCPKCGKNLPDEGFKGFCKECYLQDHAIINFKGKMFFEKCPTCDKIKVKHEWKPYSDENLLSSISRFIKTSGKAVLTKYEDEKAKIKVFKELDGTLLTQEFDIEIKEQKNQCTSCSRVSGNYFEATIQVRFSGKIDKSLLEEVEELISKQRGHDSLSAVTKIIENKKGYDIQIGSAKAAYSAAKQIAQKEGSKVTTTYSFTGLDKDQKKKYRKTFLIRVK